MSKERTINQARDLFRVFGFNIFYDKDIEALNLEITNNDIKHIQMFNCLEVRKRGNEESSYRFSKEPFINKNTTYDLLANIEEKTSSMTRVVPISSILDIQIGDSVKMKRDNRVGIVIGYSKKYNRCAKVVWGENTTVKIVDITFMEKIILNYEKEEK